MPSEYPPYCAAGADTGVRRWIMPGWIFTHIASGEYRDQVTAARLKRMGVVAGFPDLIFFGPHGEVCALELKAKNGRLSDVPPRWGPHLRQAAHGLICGVLLDYREVIATLVAWRVLRGITVQLIWLA